jgi:hypothetical protein
MINLKKNKTVKDLSKLKTVLDLAHDFESKGTDKKLAEGVKQTTKLLLAKKPDTTFEDILMNLLMSARESYKHMVKSGEIDSTVDMFMNLVDMMVEEEDDKLEDNETIILREILKGQLIKNMLTKSFNVSVKAVTEVWTGMHGTES